MPFPLAVSRRRLLGDGVAAALTVAGAAAVAGCRRSTIPGATEVPRAQSGPWSSTDSLDQTIRLPTRPTRIAAYGDAAAPLINFGVTPVALFPCTDPRQDGTFEGLDLSNVTIIGTTYEEINREELAAAAPELIVTTTQPSSTVDTLYGFSDAAQVTMIHEIAPVIGVARSAPRST